jgi:hypothetical protein
MNKCVRRLSVVSDLHCLIPCANTAAPSAPMFVLSIES